MIPPREQIAVVDCETTGLDPDTHEVWEVCVATWGNVGAQTTERWRYKTWQLPVDLGKADPVALRIGQFHERRLPDTNMGPSILQELTPRRRFVEEFAPLIREKHILGAVPSFDEAFLKRLFRRSGGCWEAHYHLIDIEAMVIGYLLGGARDTDSTIAYMLPWKSTDLAATIGVNSEDFAQHTAEGDVRWTIAQWEAMYGE